MKRKKRGFTLIELVIVVAIIGILALLVIPRFSEVVKEARVAKFKSNCKVINSAIVMYGSKEAGNVPPDEKTLSKYIDGGWKSVTSGDSKAAYDYKGPGGPVIFEASYKDDGDEYTFTVNQFGEITTTGEW